MSDQLRQALVQAVVTCAEPIRRDFRKPQAAAIKTDGTEVLPTDTEVNQSLIEALSKLGFRFIIGEEIDQWPEPIPDEKTLVVALDPLDGTSAYRRGLPSTTCIATILRVEHSMYTPVAAVIHDPILGWTWSAGAYLGAYVINPGQDEQPAIVNSEHKDRLRATVSTWPNVPFQLEAVAQTLIADRNNWSQFEYQGIGIVGGLMVQGLLDVAAFAGKSALETAAISLIVHEAGGCVMNIAEQPIERFQLTVKDDGKRDLLLPQGVIFGATKNVCKKLAKIIRSHQ